MRPRRICREARNGRWGSVDVKFSRWRFLEWKHLHWSVTIFGYFFLERSVILSKDSWLQSTSIECVYSMNGLLWVAINELYLLAGEMTCDVAVTERASLAEVAVMRRGLCPDCQLYDTIGEPLTTAKSQRPRTRSQDNPARKSFSRKSGIAKPSSLITIPVPLP